MRKIILLFSILFILISLSSCWNYREIEDLNIVSGMAIDKKDEMFLVTFEIVDIQGGSDPQLGTLLIGSEGETIFRAVRNAIKSAGKKLYFSHAKVVVVSKQIAKEDIIPILDWIGRDAEPRHTLRVIISQQETAKEILDMTPVSHDVFSFELEEILRSQRSLSESPDIKEWELISDLSEKGVGAMLPTVYTKMMGGKSCFEVCGSAVFKEGKLVGFLDNLETKSALAIRNEVKGGIITGEVNGIQVSLEIIKNRTKVKPIYEKGNLYMDVKIETHVAIAEIAGKEDVISEPGRSMLKESAEREIESIVEDVLKKCQNEFKSDIFGFGQKVKIEYPKLWKDLEYKWCDEFKNLDVNVKSEIIIKNSALQSKPMRAGEENW